MSLTIKSYISLTRFLNYSPSTLQEESRQLSQYSDYAMGWTAEESGFDSQQRQQIFIFFTAPRAALGPTQPPIQWILGPLSLGVKQLGHKEYM
jgi:hypothetical protein